jgi:hypothetical protein
LNSETYTSRRPEGEGQEDGDHGGHVPSLQKVQGLQGHRRLPRFRRDPEVVRQERRLHRTRQGAFQDVDQLGREAHQGGDQEAHERAVRSRGRRGFHAFQAVLGKDVQ